MARGKKGWWGDCTQPQITEIICARRICKPLKGLGHHLLCESRGDGVVRAHLGMDRVFRILVGQLRACQDKHRSARLQWRSSSSISLGHLLRLGRLPTQNQESSPLRCSALAVVLLLASLQTAAACTPRGSLFVEGPAAPGTCLSCEEISSLDPEEPCQLEPPGVDPPGLDCCPVCHTVCV